MTREEAIKIIKECKEKKFKYTLYTVNEYHAAMEMAIEALDDENDLIDRVLEIIAEEIYADEKIMLMEEDESIAECISRSIDSMDIIRRRVVDMKGGEQE